MDSNTKQKIKIAFEKVKGAFEKVNLKGGVGVNNIAYGAIYGGDTDMFLMKNGFKLSIVFRLLWIKQKRIVILLQYGFLFLFLFS